MEVLTDFLRSFCPNLSAISTTLKLSHNVAVSFWSSSGTLEGGPEGVRAWEMGDGSWPGQPGAPALRPLDMSLHGVTFLAFGNGAPDIFSALVAFSDPRTAGLAFGALFGMSERPWLRVRGLGGQPEVGAGWTEPGLLSRRRGRAGHHRGSRRDRHPASLHGGLQALPQRHHLLHGGRAADLHRALPRQGHAGVGPG